LQLNGFTLVEVTLAIGIISFAFVAMFGMLPVGLNLSRQAMDTTIEAQIVQQLKTQALQTDFSQLGTLDQVGDYFFDEQGKPSAPEKALYKAGYFPVPQNTRLPSSATTSKLATVTIAVLNTKANTSAAAADLRTDSDAKKFTILIPDNGL
jgi:uncharacterized protein (TIGR02598 family)